MFHLSETIEFRIYASILFVSIPLLFLYFRTRSRQWDAFNTPVPQPLHDFNVQQQKPMMYRPFRHGPNYVTMGIRKMSWDNWIEMDCNFMRYHDLKVSELNKDLDAHVKYVNNKVTIKACFELLEQLTKYLTHRYPTVYKLNGKILHNTLTGEKFQCPAGTQSPLSQFFLPHTHKI